MTKTYPDCRASPNITASRLTVPKHDCIAVPLRTVASRTLTNLDCLTMSRRTMTLLAVPGLDTLRLDCRTYPCPSPHKPARPRLPNLFHNLDMIRPKNAISLRSPLTNANTSSARIDHIDNVVECHAESRVDAECQIAIPLCKHRSVSQIR